MEKQPIPTYENSVNKRPMRLRKYVGGRCHYKTMNQIYQPAIRRSKHQWVMVFPLPQSVNENPQENEAEKVLPPTQREGGNTHEID